LILLHTVSNPATGQSPSFYKSVPLQVFPAGQLLGFDTQKSVLFQIEENLSVGIIPCGLTHRRPGAS
jgi:hypothetical protein